MLVSPGPLIRYAARPVLRAAAPRLDILDDLKYQLSNADEGSRPARDLVENPVAFAYLGVLALFGAGLAYLAYQDTQINAKRQAAFMEQKQAAEMLRAQGLDEEAAVLDRDLKKERKTAKPKAEAPKGYAGSSFAEDDPGNRFERRQGSTARKKRQKKGKQGKK